MKSIFSGEGETMKVALTASGHGGLLVGQCCCQRPYMPCGLWWGETRAACMEEVSLAQGPPVHKPWVRVPRSQHSEHMLGSAQRQGCVSWGLSGHRVIWVSGSTVSRAWLE